MRCGGSWKRSYGTTYTGTNWETPDTDKVGPSELPRQLSTLPGPFFSKLRDYRRLQSELAASVGDQPPQFFVVMTDLNPTVQPCPNRTGVLLVTELYERVHASRFSPSTKVVRRGAGAAFSTWFFTRDMRVYTVDALAAVAIDLARSSGFAARDLVDAYAQAEAAAAKSSVTIPIFSLQLPPFIAAVLLVVSALGIQIYTSAALRTIQSSKALDYDEMYFGANRLLALQWVFMYAVGVLTCICLPPLTIWWAMQLINWAPWRNLEPDALNWSLLAVSGPIVLVLVLVVLANSWSLAKNQWKPILQALDAVLRAGRS